MSPPASAPTPAAPGVLPSDPPQVAISQRLTKLCDQCGKRFRRTEHLIRHQRTHSGETPFRCPRCNRGFQRSDVRNRHVATICFSKSSYPLSLTGYTGPARARVACDACRLQKLKCTGRQPCPRCVRMGRECSFTGTAKSALDSMVNNESLDIHLDDDQGAVQGQDYYYPEEQGRQGNSEPSSSSTPVRASNETSLAHADTSQGISFSPALSADDSRPHDLGLDLNDEIAATPQPELSLRSIDTSTRSSGTDEVVQEVPSAPCPTERPQFNLIQRLTSPSTSLTLAMDLELDSWLDYVPFDDNMFDLFPLTEDYLNGCGSNMDAASDSQQLNGDFLTAQFDPQQLIGHLTQQCQLPAIARNLFPRLDHDASRWLATKPSISNFDRTIVNRFLNLFFAQAPSTFTSFESFRINSSTHEEELLAAAAFGGLYCTTRGSLVIARALCSDARRLFLTRIRTNFPVEVDAKIGLLRPMLLLELFGICSGDKRLCELTEAFHIQFLQILSDCLLSASTTGHNNIVLQQILQDFQLLECYRTTLLQMLPYLYPGMSIFNLVPQLSTPKEMKVIDIVKKLFSPTEPRPDLSDPHTSTAALTSLLVMSYHASPSRCVTSSQSESLWDKRFFELGLDSWLRSHKSSPDVSTLLLFHIGMVSLNTNMAKLHVLVRNAFIHHTSLPIVMASAGQWSESHEAEIATMHADRVLDLSTTFYGNIRDPRRSANSSMNRLGKASKGMIEAPHVAICVYLAAITLWAAHRVDKSRLLNTARPALSRGVRILEQLSLSAASNFTRILKYLEEN